MTFSADPNTCLKTNPIISFWFLETYRNAVKGVLEYQSNSLCYSQNLKFRSHIHSPKSHMQKSIDKSRCKLGDLNWMVKQANKTDVNVSSSQRLLAVHSKQLKCFLSVPGNGAPSSELFPTSIHLLKCFQAGLLLACYVIRSPFAHCCKRC